MTESDESSDYHFDITEYTNEKFRRTEARNKNKGRAQAWDFFDPEDLANLALTKLWGPVKQDPDSFREKVSVDRLFSTIVIGIWIDEVRRELEVTNLHGSGAVCVSLFGALNGQVSQLGLEFEVALRELLEHVKAKLSSRHREIVDLLLAGETQLDISLKLEISESTLKRDITSLRKAIVKRLREDFEQPTTNNQQPTTNNQQPGSNPS